MRLSRLSTEDLIIPVEGEDDDGTPIDPTTGSDPEFAIVAENVEPDEADWLIGEWQTDTTVSPSDYAVRLRVGPGSDTGELDLGSYDAWTRWTPAGGGLVVKRSLGFLEVF